MKNNDQQVKHTGMRMTRPEDLVFWCLLQAVTQLVPRAEWPMLKYDTMCAANGL